MKKKNNNKTKKNEAAYKFFKKSAASLSKEKLIELLYVTAILSNDGEKRKLNIMTDIFVGKIKSPDPKYIGIPNINFSALDDDDKRDVAASKERIKNGFDYSELWGLHYTISSFIYPRLKAFRNSLYSCPGYLCYKNDKDMGVDYGMKLWKEILDKMLFSFLMLSDDDEKEKCEPQDITSQEHEAFENKIEEGLKLFSEHFRSLWN